MFKKIILIELFLATMIFGQADISKISVSLGLIKNLQPYDLNNYYSLFPEIEIGGNLINSQTSWHLFLNYFDDNVNDIKPVRDLGIFYSYKVIEIGAQVGVTILDSSAINFPLRIRLLGGTSMNFIKGRNIIDNPYLNPSNKKEMSDHINNLDIGIRANYLITKLLELVFEYKQLFMLDNKTASYAKSRNAIRLGIEVNY